MRVVVDAWHCVCVDGEELDASVVFSMLIDEDSDEEAKEEPVAFSCAKQHFTAHKPQVIFRSNEKSRSPRKKKVNAPPTSHSSASPTVRPQTRLEQWLLPPR